ncbi:MAG TPA: hypothetical protein VF006_18030 [Longimicrobium sp.]
MSAKDISWWRSQTGAALVVMVVALGSRTLSRAPFDQPTPRPEDFVRMHGTVQRMRVYTEKGSCLLLFLRIDTERGRVTAWNRALCQALEGLTPLPPGAQVTVLVEQTAEGYVVWEMKSRGRVLIPFEWMRANWEAAKRGHRSMPTFIAIVCVLGLSVIAAWLWQEFSRWKGGKVRE